MLNTLARLIGVVFEVEPLIAPKRTGAWPKYSREVDRVRAIVEA